MVAKTPTLKKLSHTPAGKWSYIKLLFRFTLSICNWKIPRFYYSGLGGSGGSGGSGGWNQQGWSNQGWDEQGAHSEPVAQVLAYGGQRPKN